MNTIVAHHPYVRTPALLQALLASRNETIWEISRSPRAKPYAAFLAIWVKHAPSIQHQAIKNESNKLFGYSAWSLLNSYLMKRIVIDTMETPQVSLSFAADGSQVGRIYARSFSENLVAMGSPFGHQQDTFWPSVGPMGHSWKDLCIHSSLNELIS